MSDLMRRYSSFAVLGGIGTFFIGLFWLLFSSLGEVEPCLFTEGDEVRLKSSGTWGQVLPHNPYVSRCELYIRLRNGGAVFRQDYELEAWTDDR